jgi:hypothetical protein
VGSTFRISVDSKEYAFLFFFACALGKVFSDKDINMKQENNTTSTLWFNSSLMFEEKFLLPLHGFTLVRIPLSAEQDSITLLN